MPTRSASTWSLGRRRAVLFGGRYHHRLATNTWLSAGTGQRGTEVGLGTVTIMLPAAADVAAVEQRVVDASVAHEVTADGIIAIDPLGNRIKILTAESLVRLWPAPRACVVRPRQG